MEQIATSGRRLDVLVGPAGTGKSTAMAGLRAAWEAEHGAGSVLGLAPSAAAAEVLAEALGIETENTAKWLHEHRQEAERLEKVAHLRAALRSSGMSGRRSARTGAAGPGRTRSGPMAASGGPVGDRGRGQPARDVRPGRAGGRRPRRPSQGGPGRRSGSVERHRCRRDVRRLGTRSGRPGAGADRCTPVREPLGEGGQRRTASGVSRRHRRL